MCGHCPASTRSCLTPHHLSLKRKGPFNRFPRVFQENGSSRRMTCNSGRSRGCLEGGGARSPPSPARTPQEGGLRGALSHAPCHTPFRHRSPPGRALETKAQGWRPGQRHTGGAARQPPGPAGPSGAPLPPTSPSAWLEGKCKERKTEDTDQSWAEEEQHRLFLVTEKGAGSTWRLPGTACGGGTRE